MILAAVLSVTICACECAFVLHSAYIDVFKRVLLSVVGTIVACELIIIGAGFVLFQPLLLSPIQCSVASIAFRLASSIQAMYSVLYTCLIMCVIAKPHIVDVIHQWSYVLAMNLTMLCLASCYEIPTVVWTLRARTDVVHSADASCLVDDDDHWWYAYHTFALQALTMCVNLIFAYFIRRTLKASIVFDLKTLSIRVLFPITFISGILRVPVMAAIVFVPGSVQEFADLVVYLLLVHGFCIVCTFSIIQNRERLPQWLLLCTFKSKVGPVIKSVPSKLFQKQVGGISNVCRIHSSFILSNAQVKQDSDHDMIKTAATSASSSNSSLPNKIQSSV